MVEENPGQYKRINKDELRKMLDGGKWSKGNEKFILEIRGNIIYKALANKQSVIVDDTNFAPEHRQTFEGMAMRTGAELVINDFTYVSLEECIRRNQHRTPRVEDKVIYDMYDRYLKPPPVVQNPDNPDAIQFDLDGTLALFGNANPYDRDCSYDTVNYPVFDELISYQSKGYKIIILSGRKGEYLEKTEEWLGKNGIHPDLFIMRAIGDTRKDYIIKKEMFMEHVLPKYNVKIVFDDRNGVVRMWRELGLTCFQVAEGNF